MFTIPNPRRGRGCSRVRRTILMALLSLSLLLPGIQNNASARDGWQNRPLVCNAEENPTPAMIKRCQDWIGNVQRPDQDGSCCGEGDAYIADAFREEGGNYYAIITRDYPAQVYDDGEGGSSSGPAVPLGREILIPPEKLNRAFQNGGNPTGHGIVFLRTNGEVLCYFGPTLS